MELRKWTVANIMNARALGGRHIQELHKNIPSMVYNKQSCEKSTPYEIPPQQADRICIQTLTGPFKNISWQPQSMAMSSQM